MSRAIGRYDLTGVAGPPTQIIRSARVFDGERLVPGGTVLLRNDRILALVDESQESVAVPDGVEGLDCADCTLLPGLIDAHVHLVAERELQQALLFGVTTELDVYTFLPLDVRAELRRPRSDVVRGAIEACRLEALGPAGIRLGSGGYAV